MRCRQRRPDDTGIIQEGSRDDGGFHLNEWDESVMLFADPSPDDEQIRREEDFEFLKVAGNALCPFLPREFP